MRQQLIDLNEIQKIDLSIREVEKQRESASKSLLELESSVSALQKEIQIKTDSKENLTKEAKVLESNIQTENLKLRKWEARLNDIRNQREYLALSREIEASKRANKEAEERMVEIAKQKTVLDQELENLQDRLGVVGIDCEQERQKVEKSLAEVNSNLATELARRDALYGTVPKAILSKYENVRAKRMGVGLVQVTDGRCMGCNMKLPPQLFNILQRVNTIEQCPSCLRIIFWDRILEDVQASNN